MSKSEPDPSSQAQPVVPARRRRWFRWTLVVLVLLGVGGELFARFYLGLGDPPLSQADPKIEYLFKADQECRRFGNRIKYNHYSMRSDDFPPRKSAANELRVLVVGDSVVNGGVQTDQSKLATELLRGRLAADLGRPAVVGNVSAGSWGPPNQLEYLKRFGLFEADVVVIVLSSHDAADRPTFEPLVGVSPGMPDHRPPLALWEGFARYVWPRLRGAAPAGNDGPPAPAPTGAAWRADADVCLGALREMIEMSQRAGARVIVAQHLQADEALASPRPGHDEIAAEARRAGVTPVELAPAFEAARARGEPPYRDNIHLSDVGQRVMAEVLAPLIERAVK